MRKPTILILAIFAALLGRGGVASALTFDEAVTPASVRENPKQFSIVTEKRADGLLHFTITLHVPRPSYLVAHAKIGDGNKVLAESSSPAFVREESATFYFAVAPERLADASFELFMGTFMESDGQPLPIPGGINFQIQLGEFAKTADAKK